MWQLRSDAESVSILQDGCNGWLSVRYGAATSSLENQFGMIGVARLSSMKQVHALKIKEQTELILREFAMPKRRMPYSKKKRNLFWIGEKNNSGFDTFWTLGLLLPSHLQLNSARTAYNKIYGLLIDRVEFLTADGAPDEQLALVTGLRLGGLVQIRFRLMIFQPVSVLTDFNLGSSWWFVWICFVPEHQSDLSRSVPFCQKAWNTKLHVTISVNNDKGCLRTRTNLFVVFVSWSGLESDRHTPTASWRKRCLDWSF